LRTHLGAIEKVNLPEIGTLVDLAKLGHRMGKVAGSLTSLAVTAHLGLKQWVCHFVEHRNLLHICSVKKKVKNIFF
jgi:hypothetical protein